MFKDLSDEFRKSGVAILKINRNTIKAQKDLEVKYNLPFKLLNNNEKASVCKAYQVLTKESVVGKKYRRIEKRKFVIDKDLNITKEHGNVKINGHQKTIWEFLIRRVS